MTRRLSNSMFSTLGALSDYEGIIHRGASVGEVVADGGTRDTLRAAVKKEWARPYGAVNGGTPRYYRTEAGKQAYEVELIIRTRVEGESK